jgi:hypothetical protein
MSSKTFGWAQQDHEVLLRLVHEAYEDMDSPRRHFVRRAVQSDRYAEMRFDLRVQFHADDDTDINCDACFVYVVRSDPVLIVKLSMVGPYASLSVDHGREGVALIESQDDCVEELERSVYRLLTRHHVRVLSRLNMAMPLPLRLPDVSRVTVYSALFSPEEDLPSWLNTQ